MTIKTICQRAAATRARRGILPSTQHSLKKLPGRKFLGTRVHVRTAAMLLPMPWWKEPQATYSFGPWPASRRTGGAGSAACPKRFSEVLTWCSDISFGRLYCARPGWRRQDHGFKDPPRQVRERRGPEGSPCTSRDSKHGLRAV